MKPVKEYKPDEEKAYRKLCAVLSRHRAGITVADVTAATALPLAQMKELLPRAADEFSARLAVTESGEIVYSFPKNFVSRYRGMGARLKRFAGKLGAGLAAAGSVFFKVWIMVMLIGYFTLFVAIAIASIVVSVAAQSKDSNNRHKRNVFFGTDIFSLIWRLWFYSEITRSSGGGRQFQNGRYQQNYQKNQNHEKARPLHRAIFSFVFGDDERNDDGKEREKKAVIAYVQANSGIISLPEFMTITGQDSARADAELMAFCAEFGGSPEATDDGVIVYRFEELLLRARREDRSFGGLSAPVAALKKFSANTKGMNTGFGLINTFNLLFGSYFLYKAVNTGALFFGARSTISGIYEFVYYLLNHIALNPLPIIGVGLGLVPFVFSLLFWIIPAARSGLVKNENEKIKLENLRRLGFGRIWSRPFEVKAADIDAQAAECRPKNMGAARERVIKEMAVYSVPDVAVDEKGAVVYSFAGLAREKESVEKCRAAVSEETSQLGGVVFDTGE